MVGGLPTDIVIPVMGPTGVGKSTFINTLLGKDKDTMLVGHDISSCTSKIEYAIIDNPSPLEGHRVIIVDTPGFDDTFVDDVEILRRISVWLASSYDANMKLGGIIYLLSIGDKRMKGTTRRNLDMFHQLCGDKGLARVILGTTNWGEVDDNTGKMREQQLAKTFSNLMNASGSTRKLLRFHKTKESARAFLGVILERLKFRGNEILNDNVLRIQNELVELNRNIPETEAGKKLLYTLEQLLEIQKNQAEDFEELSASLAKQIAELHVSLPRKWYLKIFGKNPT